MNRWLAVVLVALSCARPARADVTVIYAEPAPAAPLAATVVEPAPEPASSAPAGASTAPSAAPAPPAAARPPAPVAEPGRPIAAPAPPPAPAPAARPPAPGLRVRVVRAAGDGEEEAMLPLLDAEGRPDLGSLTELSLLARPDDTERPDAEALAAHEDDLQQVAPGLPRLHPGLLLRLARIAERFPGRTIEIVSGVRPDARATSRHRIARAIDVRVIGVGIEALDALLRTLPETGVGLCPGAGFVHLDVRARSAHWIEVGASDGG